VGSVEGVDEGACVGTTEGVCEGAVVGMGVLMVFEVVVGAFVGTPPRITTSAEGKEVGATVVGC